MKGLCVLLALIVFAQSAEARGGRRNRDDDAQSAAKKAKSVEAEKAYQDALKRIPDKNIKVDPWGNMR